MAKYLKLSSFPVVDYGHLSAPVSFTIDSRWADFTDLGGVYALSVRIQLVLALLSKLGCDRYSKDRKLKLFKEGSKRLSKHLDVVGIV